MKILLIILLIALWLLILFTIRVINVCNAYQTKYNVTMRELRKQKEKYTKFYSLIATELNAQHERYPKRKGIEEIMQFVDTVFDQIEQESYLDEEKTHC